MQRRKSGSRPNAAGNAAAGAATEGRPRRHMMGVPEWNEAEINAVLELWMQHNRQPQWKPIAKELAALNATGALNGELAAKGLERTNNAVMNKVKELSGLSCARRVKPRTVGNFANWCTNPPLSAPADASAASNGVHADIAGAELEAITTAARTAMHSPSVAGGAALQGAVAIATAQFLAEHVEERLPAIPMPPSCSSLPPPPGPSVSSISHSSSREMPRKRRHLTHWPIQVGVRSRHLPLIAVSPAPPEVPVIVQRKAVMPSYAAGTSPAVRIVGPSLPGAACPILQEDL
jgi:hypothetical protein